jgi:uncharacterized protein YqjF (DUF2071 family)
LRELPVDILGATGHRPWPLSAKRWVQRQTWNDFLFCHWPIPADAMRRVVPPELELDLWDGQAWLGIIPFHMSGVTLRGLPDLPGFSRFPELNVRTYVRVGDRTGVHFLSLEAHNPLAVCLARAWYGLPYFRARMAWERVGDRIHYRSVRTHPGAPPARYEAWYRPTGPVVPAEPGSFEHWLTERYALYLVDRRRRIWWADVHHRPWPLRAAEIEVVENTMAAAHGLVLPDTPPHVRYAPKVDVLCWGPQCRVDVAPEPA